MTMKINDNGIDRDMTEAEQEAHEAWAKIAQAEAKAFTEAQAERAAARKAVLDKLGLTADEAAALLG
jgi:head-tail adaptor